MTKYSYRYINTVNLIVLKGTTIAQYNVDFKIISKPTSDGAFIICLLTLFTFMISVLKKHSFM